MPCNLYDDLSCLPFDCARQIVQAAGSQVVQACGVANIGDISSSIIRCQGGQE